MTDPAQNTREKQAVQDEFRKSYPQIIPTEKTSKPLLHVSGKQFRGKLNEITDYFVSKKFYCNKTHPDVGIDRVGIGNVRSWDQELSEHLIQIMLMLF